MARMIPPYLPVDCRSPGERLLFGRLKDDPSTADWVVLHSLGVARHPKRLEGEIDFVVIVPDQGVLCLEVKSGHVARINGTWRYGSGAAAESSTIGPFRQASEAMHAIRQYVTRADPNLRQLLFFSGVVFTYSDFAETSTEWHSWQYLNREMLVRSSVASCFLRLLHKAHEHVRSTASAKWYDPKRSRPTAAQVKRLGELLRGDFEYFVNPRAALEQAEQDIRRFTEEQFSALDVLEENQRIIYKGPAGTGKTFLAIEAARRSCQSGKRTLLVCFNRLLGNWLSDETRVLSEQYPGLMTTDTFHRILLRLSGASPPDTADQRFWSKVLPDTVIERVLSGAVEAPVFDTVVLDEAQDLITDEYLDVLDLLLVGGLAGGRWVMFGDFERQAIYREHRSVQDVPVIIKARSPVHFVFPLRINCRNMEPIAVGLELACRLEPGYSRFLHTGAKSDDIEIDFYRTAEEQIGRLRAHVRALRQAFRPSEIVILSIREDRSSCASLLSQSEPSLKLQPIREIGADKSVTGYSTIHAFKGLEAPAVILTDISAVSGDTAEALLYIGMSRPRLKLVMLMQEDCRQVYLRNVHEGFSARGRKVGSHGRN